MDPNHWRSGDDPSSIGKRPLDSYPGLADRIGDGGEYVSAVGRRMGNFVLEAFVEGNRDSAVFRARRVMGAGVTLAAVKLLRTGSPEPEVARLLDEERRSLATLDHRAIPRLLGSGTTYDGWSWFAQEYVLGWPLFQHAEHEGLGLEARVRLLIEMCRAVEHAHQRKVLHPDLRPGNLMVTTRGEPKVVGFGLPGLPTGRNVAELGELIFATLLPVRPFLGELRGSEGGAPSRSHPFLRPRPRTDIDRVCLKAVGHGPWEHYGSADGLADDLERVLARRPVSARHIGVAARVRSVLARIPWSGLAGAASPVAPSPSQGR